MRWVRDELVALPFRLNDMCGFLANWKPWRDTLQGNVFICGMLNILTPSCVGVASARLRCDCAINPHLAALTKE